MNEFRPANQDLNVTAISSAASLNVPSITVSSASSYAGLNLLFGDQDPNMLLSKSNRNKRRPSEGSDHTKHRRTRSGCFTCRSRRVKCDENRPTCERCRKGNRECAYPEASTSSKSSKGKTRKGSTQESIDSSSDDSDVDGESERLESIPDAEESVEGLGNPKNAHKIGNASSASRPRVAKSAVRHPSETPSLVYDKATSPTPSTEGSVGYASYHNLGNTLHQSTSMPWPTETKDLRSDWSHLPPDLQFYLAYFYENVTYLHYSLKYDSGNFLQTQFLDAALRNDALLHAVVGFSAFQRTLHNPGGKIEDFLPYYNKAVSLLLLSFKRGQKHDIGTILAILQLATIEEFLGDWINLLGHQKAAFEILTEIYTPETIMQTQMTRIILAWYSRFDIFAGLLAGFETTLSRDWFSYGNEYFEKQVVREPDNLDWKIEAAITRYRLLATDMSVLFAKLGKGEISHPDFVTENSQLSQRIDEWKIQLDPALQDPRYLVNEFSNARPLGPDSIVDPYTPGVLYRGPLWAINVVTIDWMSIDVMHKYQTALIQGIPPSPEIALKAYACCQLFEAVEYYPDSPAGMVIACQASLGIAVLFLPRDKRHSMWARRKLANIEAQGYIFPYTFRTKMADLFKDRSCMHWWLPNEERYPAIVRSIRKFVEERTATAKDVISEDLRDMKNIFSSLNLSEGEASLPKDHQNDTVGALDWKNPASRPGDLQKVSSTQEFGHDEGQILWEEGQGDGDYLGKISSAFR